MIGRTYLERGSPVVVLARWGATAWRPDPFIVRLDGSTTGKGAPRNVRIRRADGATVVRPFRGLRKIPAAAAVAGEVVL